MPDTQASRIIDRWPGQTRPDRRKALARALGHKDEEKVRYWQKCRWIPQREWAGIIAVAAEAEIDIKPEDFVRHLKDPAETAVADSATA